MQAQKTLRRPNNWQDFETLCLKLWGEIWDCHEIKKNGRTGQNQHGVDVYGMPKWENEYYGIQCKGKDEYTDKQFTAKEIDEEVEKAKYFKPKLKKLYFATTAVKDAVIEEYVREKNLQHIASGLFEVHLYSWEDIVDKIDEHKQTHDWYVKNQNYKSSQAVEVTFGDGSKEITLFPQYKQHSLVYTTIDFESMIPSSMTALAKSPFFAHNSFLGQKNPDFSPTINKSYVNFFIRIQNTGREPIEDYKLLLKFKGSIQNLANTNKREGKFSIISALSRQSSFSTHLHPENMAATIVKPVQSLLVGDDTFSSDDIYIKPYPNETQIEIDWKLISRDFKSEGKLIIKLQAEIKGDEKFIKVNKKSEERTELGEFEDVIVLASSENNEATD